MSICLSIIHICMYNLYIYKYKYVIFHDSHNSGGDFWVQSVRVKPDMVKCASQSRIIHMSQIFTVHLRNSI